MRSFVFRHAGLVLLLVVSNGCALHYASSKSGNETVFGLGRVAWQVTDLTNGFTSVTSGTRIPGFVIGVGSDFSGVSFGYEIRKNLFVSETKFAPAYQATLNAKPVSGNLRKSWKFGKVSFRTPGARHSRFMTGRAIAGGSLSVRNGRPDLSLRSKPLNEPRSMKPTLTFPSPERR